MDDYYLYTDEPGFKSGLVSGYTYLAARSRAESKRTVFLGVCEGASSFCGVHLQPRRDLSSDVGQQAVTNDLVAVVLALTGQFADNQLAVRQVADWTTIAD